MASVGVVGIFSFVVIADLGINAGLIHYGVKIGHLDVGGMSPVAAERLVQEVGREVASTPIVFRGGSLGTYSWTPSDLGWEPRTFEMTERAMKVGRRGNVFRSFGDRLRSWAGGIQIRWGAPSRNMIRLLALAVAEEAERQGLAVDQAELQSRMRAATWDWPREPFYEIPFES